MVRPEFAAVTLLLLGLVGSAHGAVPQEVRQALLQRDFAGAASRLEAAAALGSADGDMLYELARLYDRGLGVPRDPGRAYDYFRQAAELSHVESLYLLGVVTELGRGTTPDRRAARTWYERASALGHELAEQRLAALDAETGPSSLVEAVEGQDIEATRRLATRDAVQQADAPGRVPLFVAVSRGNAELVEVLLAAGADPLQVDAAGRLPLHHAAASGRLALCRVLVAAGTPVDVQDTAGNSALHLAVSNGHEALVAWLLDQGAAGGLANADGWTPRMLASRGADPALQRLLRITTDPALAGRQRRAELQRAAEERGWSELAVAAWAGDLKLVEELLSQGADPDAPDSSGKGPIYRAVSEGHADVAMLLLEAGAQVAAPSGEAGLLHLVARRGPDALLPVLIARSGLRDTRDKRGNTPLLLAAEAGRDPAVRALVDAGADVRASNLDGASVLHFLAQTGQTDLIDLLVRAGAPVNARDRAGRTPLWLAVRAERLGAASRLVHHGADFRGADGGVTPQHVAAELERAELVTHLLRAGAPVDARSASGSTPLLLAANRGRFQAVRLLLDAGAEIDARNELGDTPLICAVRSGHKHVSRYLLSRGASSRSRNARYESARDLAAGHGDPEWDAMFRGSGVIGLLQRDEPSQEVIE